MKMLSNSLARGRENSQNVDPAQVLRRWRRRCLCAAVVFLTPAAVWAADPMLTLVDAARLQEVTRRHAGAPALVFTESREFPIRRVQGLPTRWLPQAEGDERDVPRPGRPGEFLRFSDRRICRRGLRAAGDGIWWPHRGVPATIPASAFRCLSLGGTNHNGQPFTKEIRLKPGQLQALWVGVAVPPTAKGDFTGTGPGPGVGEQSNSGAHHAECGWFGAERMRATPSQGISPASAGWTRPWAANRR